MKDPTVLYFDTLNNMFSLRVGNELLEITDKALLDTTKTLYSVCLTDRAQIKIIKKLVNNLEEK